MTSIPPGSRRVHVTTACASCRDNKVKCDGASPSCANCKTKGKECIYQAGDDKRKLTLRFAVELLSRHIDQLYRFISDHSLDPPSMGADDHAALLRVLAYQRIAPSILAQELRPGFAKNDASSMHLAESTIHCGTTTGVKDPLPLSNPSPLSAWSTGTSAQWSHANSVPGTTMTEATTDPSLETWPNPGDSTIDVDPQPLWTWDQGEDPGISSQPIPYPEKSVRAELPSLFTSGSGQARCNQELHRSISARYEDSYSSADSTEALVDQLSERIGSLQIGPGGHIRFYGPTSNFNLVKMPTPNTFTLHRTVRNDGQGCLNRLGLGKEVPLVLEDHLVSLYFAWQDPALHVVDRDMYEEARASWREKNDTPYYSEALHNAICALGAAFETRHHPSFVTFPRTLAEFFADRAKALLEIELDCPCVATVQAMAVLSSHEIGCKRDSRGWLYSGMAMRLAFDLGLHMDMTPYVANGSLSHAEADLRKNLFWGTYVIDHTWGFHLGRPFRINMEGATVSKPSGEAYPTRQWTPYTSAESMDNRVFLPDHAREVHRQRVTLAEIMAPVGDPLYGNLKISIKTLQEINADTVARLLKWKDDLPPALRVDLEGSHTYYLPHVLLLHMQYHQNIIHAHRPYMSRTYVQPFPPQGPGSDHARMMCMGSALAISKLLQLYERRYALRHIHVQAVGIVCSAALLLVFAHVTRYYRDDALTGRHLGACFRALEAFESSWESAKRARDFLLLLQRQWELRGRSSSASSSSSSLSSSGGGRPPPGEEGEEAFPGAADPVPRKRTRTLEMESSGLEDQLPRMRPAVTHGVGDPVDVELGLDLEWIVTGFPFNVS